MFVYFCSSRPFHLPLISSVLIYEDLPEASALLSVVYGHCPNCRDSPSAFGCPREGHTDATDRTVQSTMEVVMGLREDLRAGRQTRTSAKSILRVIYCENYTLLVDRWLIFIPRI